MKISTREDITLPIETVFAAISDFEAFERRAIRRRADLSRTDPASGPGLGTSWDITFTFRGKERRLSATVTEFEAPSGHVISSKSDGLTGIYTVELLSLNPQKTRITTGFELTPNNLSSRLLVQSLKLAKGSITKRFCTAVTDFARGLEKDHKDASATLS